jgi:hypothetical protein
MELHTSSMKSRELVSCPQLRSGFMQPFRRPCGEAARLVSEEKHPAKKILRDRKERDILMAM